MATSGPGGATASGPAACCEGLVEPKQGERRIDRTKPGQQQLRGGRIVKNVALSDILTS